MNNHVIENITELIKDKKYTRVVAKVIAVKKDGNWENFFSSFTFANDNFLAVNDAEWRVLSRDPLPTPSNYDELKKIVEFDVEKDKCLIMRKHIGIDELYKILIDMHQHAFYQLDGQIIKANIRIDSNEIYKIGSHSDSIFVNANTNLCRMADVIVGWSKDDRIYVLDKILNIQINDVAVYNPIETLIGFLGYNIPKELCSSICIYLPNYVAWLAGERFRDGKSVEVGICSEEEDILRNLILLYKINKSNETIIWNSYKFDKAPEFNTEKEHVVFYQPVQKDIDTALCLLIDNDFTIHDFSSEVPYVKSFICTMDAVGGIRKYRSSFQVGRSEKNCDIITKRKASVASMKQETTLFASGDQHIAIETVKRILDSARKTIAIMDPYLGNDITDWNIFENIAYNINVKIITSTESRSNLPSDFATALAQLKQEIPNLQVRNIYVNVLSRNRPLCPFHDRYFIIDDILVWSIGTSINGLGKRDSSIVKIDGVSLKEIVNRFNYYWDFEDPIHKMLVNDTWIDFPIQRINL